MRFLGFFAAFILPALALAEPLPCGSVTGNYSIRFTQDQSDRVFGYVVYLDELEMGTILSDAVTATDEGLKILTEMDLLQDHKLQMKSFTQDVDGNKYFSEVSNELNIPATVSGPCLLPSPVILDISILINPDGTGNILNLTITPQ